MNLIAEYEPPQCIRVQCEAFRILASYKGGSDLDKEALLDELCLLCSNDSDFRDVFYAAYTLSFLRINNTGIFDYVMCQLLIRDKLQNPQPLNLSMSTIQYFHKNGIVCDNNYDPTEFHGNSDLSKIFSEDNLKEFINHSLFNTDNNIKAKIGENIINGSKLVVACAFNAENIVRYLIPFEKDLTDAAKVAAAFGNFSIFRLLEQCGADISLAYDIAVKTHQYEIIDYIRFNCKNISARRNIELESNNILAYLTKENDEITFDDAQILLGNGNISMFKYLWGEKAPPPGHNFESIAMEIGYLSILGEYDLVRALTSSDEVKQMETNDEFTLMDMFVYSELEMSKKIIAKKLLFFDEYSMDMMAALGNKEHAKLVLENYIKAGFNIPSNIAALLCIIKDKDYIDKAIEAGMDFTFNGNLKIPSNIFFGTKDVDFTKYFLERTKIKPDFVHSLNIAIIRRNIDMVNFVLDCLDKTSLKIKEYSYFGNSNTLQHQHPLHMAAVVESIPIMEILLNKFDINESSDDGAIALHFAAITGNIELFDYMISKGADIRKETNNGCTVLHLAALYGNIEIVKRIVEITGTELLDKVDKLTKLTPISASLIYMENKSRKVFDFLLSCGAGLNVENSLTPLMCAIDRINPDEGFILELLENSSINVNVEVECIRGKANALHYAIGKEMNNIARILIDKGARCTDTLIGDMPDIGAAILCMERDVPFRLITEKRYKEINECPAMIFAVAKCDSVLVSAILEESKRPEDIETGLFDMTPLKVAILEGNVHLVEMLIKMGANINASHAINPVPFTKGRAFGVGIGRNHGINNNLVPARSEISHISFDSYAGTAANIALWKGDAEVLEVIGLQGPGKNPAVTRKHCCSRQYYRYISSSKFDKSAVPFTRDLSNPNAENLSFGSAQYSFRNRITDNDFIELFNNGDVNISCPRCCVPFSPKFHYL